MKIILIIFALLSGGIASASGKSDDLKTVKSLADRVIKNYGYWFYTPETGQKYYTVDEIPRNTHVRAGEQFFDWTYTTGIP